MLVLYNFPYTVLYIHMTMIIQIWNIVNCWLLNVQEQFIHACLERCSNVKYLGYDDNIKTLQTNSA